MTNSSLMMMMMKMMKFMLPCCPICWCSSLGYRVCCIVAILHVPKTTSFNYPMYPRHINLMRMRMFSYWLSLPLAHHITSELSTVIPIFLITILLKKSSYHWHVIVIFIPIFIIVLVKNSLTIGNSSSSSSKSDHHHFSNNPLTIGMSLSSSS